MASNNLSYGTLDYPLLASLHELALFSFICFGYELNRNHLHYILKKIRKAHILKIMSCFKRVQNKLKEIAQLV